MNGFDFTYGDILYFAYLKNNSKKFNEYLIFPTIFSEPKKSGGYYSIKGINLHKLFSIDPEYLVYFYYTIEHSIGRKVFNPMNITEDEFKAVINLILSHPINSNKIKEYENIQQKELKNKKDQFTTAIMNSFEQFILDPYRMGKIKVIKNLKDIEKILNI